MNDNVEIGLGRSGRRGYSLDDIGIVPSRRTRDIDVVSLTWQIDAYRFELPLVGFPSDATMSPTTIAGGARIGGLGVLHARHMDALRRPGADPREAGRRGPHRSDNRAAAGL